MGTKIKKNQVKHTVRWTERGGNTFDHHHLFREASADLFAPSERHIYEHHMRQAWSPLNTERQAATLPFFAWKIPFRFRQAENGLLLRAKQSEYFGGFFFAVRAVSAQSPHFYYLAENDNKDPPCLGVKSHIHLNWRLAGSCGMEMDLKPFTGGSWQAQWKRTSSSPVLAHIAWKSSVKIFFFFPPAYLGDVEKKGCLSSSVHLSRRKGGFWSASMLCSWCKAYSSSWYLVDKFKKKKKVPSKS